VHIDTSDLVLTFLLQNQPMQLYDI